MDLLTSFLVSTKTALLRLVPQVRAKDESVLGEIAARRGLASVASAAKGRICGLDLELRDARPGQFLEIALRGGQPEHLDLCGRSDAGHPVLRALGRSVHRRVSAALEVDATLSSGVWVLPIWEPHRADAVERLLDLALDAACALAEQSPAAIDRAMVSCDPDLTARRLQLEAAITARRADLDWLACLSWDDAPEIALCAASAIGEHGREPLRALLEDPYVAERSALALSRLPRGDEAKHVERLLLSGAEAGFIEAIDALGRFGSIRALPALQRLSEHALGLSGLARHARGAIDAIRAREGHPGSLSLAAAEGGTLAVSALAHHCTRP